MSRFNFKEFLGRFINGVDECPLFELLKGLPDVSTSGPWVAGGAVRRTLLQEPLSSDIDYFFRDEEQKAAFCLTMLTRGARMISEKDHATTFSIQIEGKGPNIIVQAITLAYYQNLEAVLDSFDFTITQFGYDGADLVCGDFSLWDLARKRLALHKLTFGVSTVRRLIKYTKQGFTACSGVLAAILESTVADPQTIHRDTEYVD